MSESGFIKRIPSSISYLCYCCSFQAMVVHPSMSQAHQSQEKEHPSERRVHHWIWILRKRNDHEDHSDKRVCTQQENEFFFSTTVSYFSITCVFHQPLFFALSTRKMGTNFRTNKRGTRFINSQTSETMTGPP